MIQSATGLQRLRRAAPSWILGKLRPALIEQAQEEMDPSRAGSPRRVIHHNADLGVTVCARGRGYRSGDSARAQLHLSAARRPMP